MQKGVKCEGAQISEVTQNSEVINSGKLLIIYAQGVAPIHSLLGARTLRIIYAWV